MKKIIINIYFTYFNLLLLSIVAIIFTIDFFEALYKPTDYNFNQYSVDVNRRSLKAYLISAGLQNLSFYLIIVLGYFGLKNARLRIIFNILMICI